MFQKWQNADLNGKFKLPMKNEFIPTNFEIYPLEKDSPSTPTLIKVHLFLTRFLLFQCIALCFSDKMFVLNVLQVALDCININSVQLTSELLTLKIMCIFHLISYVCLVFS